VTKVALTTLIIGDTYVDNWNRACRANWEAYCRRHGYDLVLFDQPLDTSPRARARSPAWQKCLIPAHARVDAYDAVVWVDSDIVINPEAPPIHAGVPPERVGAVEMFDSPTRPWFELAHRRLCELYAAGGMRSYASPAEWYEQRGFPDAPPEVVQTGVMVTSPRHHAALFTHAYMVHEDRGSAWYHYEMPALSYEITKAGLFHVIDSRFNILWFYEMLLHYPFLAAAAPARSPSLGWILQNIKRRRLQALRPLFIRSTLERSYFLHFAGCSNDMRCIAQPTRS
jgi:hypothetical protein